MYANAVVPNPTAHAKGAGTVLRDVLRRRARQEPSDGGRKLFMERRRRATRGGKGILSKTAARSLRESGRKGIKKK